MSDKENRGFPGMWNDKCSITLEKQYYKKSVLETCTFHRSLVSVRVHHFRMN